VGWGAWLAIGDGLTDRHAARSTDEGHPSRAELEFRIHVPPADSPSLAGFLLFVSKSQQLPRRARARPGDMAGRDAQGSSTSRQLPVISLSGPISVPQRRLRRFRRPRLHWCAKRGRVKRCDQALISVRLRQSRARCAAGTRSAADANAPAACLRSDRAADGRRGWLR